MSRLRIQLLVATALVATASFAGGTAASAAAEQHVQAQVQARPGVVGGFGYGTGATALAAEHAADEALHGDYFGCSTPVLVYDTENPDGTWSAEVSAVCKNPQ
jgi:O-glycosyl hydrolase